MKMKQRETKSETATTMANDTEIEVPSTSIDGSLIFHVLSDVLAFLLYMHRQIPSLLQDMTLEFDSLQTEYKELEGVLTQSELNASSRRKHTGRKRDVKYKIRRMEKLMHTICAVQNALHLMINELPNIEHVTFVFGASPRRPQHVYEIRFPHGKMDTLAFEDMTRSRATEMLSRKVIRALISKGVGSDSYTGPSKLFLLVKAPSSFNMPLHFIPKRDFQYSKKILPSRLQLRSRSSCQDMDTSGSISEETTKSDPGKNASSDEMWFQCRHVIKGLATGNPSSEE